jgi:hypothetical protein
VPSVTAGTVGAAVVVVLFAADVGIGGASVVGNTSRVCLMSRIDTSSFCLVYFFIWSEWDLELDLTDLCNSSFFFENKVDTSHTAGWNGDLKTVGK